MSDVVLKSGRTLKVGDFQWDILPDQLPLEFTDMLLEARHLNGVVYLSFGGAILDDSNKHVVKPVARLRMSLVAAQGLTQALKSIIEDATKPPDIAKAN